VKFRRRVAIELIIGHLKSEHKMDKNFLKGFKGDEVNLLMATGTLNFKKWMRIYFFYSFFRELCSIARVNCKATKTV